MRVKVQRPSIYAHIVNCIEIEARSDDFAYIFHIIFHQHSLQFHTITRTYIVRIDKGFLCHCDDVRVWRNALKFITPKNIRVAKASDELITVSRYVIVSIERSFITIVRFMDGPFPSSERSV